MHYLLEVCRVSPHVRDRNLNTPLHIVCSHGHMDALKYLLKKEVSYPDNNCTFIITQFRDAQISARFVIWFVGNTEASGV